MRGITGSSSNMSGESRASMVTARLFTSRAKGPGQAWTDDGENKAQKRVQSKYMMLY